MPEQTFTLYLDESGDDALHSEEEYIANPNLETHCTLVGVIVPNNKKDLLRDRLNVLKSEIWKSTDVILHSIKIRNKTGPFAVFHYKPELYETFKSRMNDIVTEITPVIICSSLNKRLWVSKYPRKLLFKDDPYAQAFVYLLERYSHFIESLKDENARGRVVVEKRGDARQNNTLKSQYDIFLNYGTQYMSFENSPYNKLAPRIEFKKKNMNIPGLQLADYLCYPFYKDHKRPSSDNKHYEFLEKFVYPGQRNKYGHKKWPV